MSQTQLFSEPPADPVSIKVTGYARASLLPIYTNERGDVDPEEGHIDVESFRETIEQVQSYMMDWGDEGEIIVKVELQAVEVMHLAELPDYYKAQVQWSTEPVNSVET